MLLRAATKACAAGHYRDDQTFSPVGTGPNNLVNAMNVDNPETKDRSPAWLRALAGEDLPTSVIIGGSTFRRVRTFKHDFFAATGLYQGGQQKIVVKIGRIAPVFGIPLAWLGRVLTEHEIRLYTLAQGIAGVPTFVGRWGATGFAHEYVEGRPLAKDAALGDCFFGQLAAILEGLHRRDIAYVDLEKRENILLGEDGRPYLIDFQISWHLPANRGGQTSFFRLIRDMLQASDRYHLYKHWRRLQPDRLSRADADRFGRPPFWIRWHRWVFRPLTLLRRQILVWLGARTDIRVRSPG